MIKVEVDKVGIEKALKKLKSKFTKAGVLKELRSRKEFVKKSVKKRTEKKNAIHIDKNFKQDK